MRFWIGARGSDMGAEAPGIGAVTAGEADSPLAGGPLALIGIAVEAPSPTWLAPHPTADVVYAALERSGRVAAYRRTGETTLAAMGEPVDAGEGVCHIAVAPDGRRLVASCWGDGTVVEVRLRPDGSLAAARPAAPATDPYASGPAAPGWAMVSADPAPTEDELIAASARVEPAPGRTASSRPGAQHPIETPSGLLIPGADDADVAALMAASAQQDEPVAERLARRLSEAAGDTAAPLPEPQGGGSAHEDGTPGGGAEPRPTRAHAAAFLPDGRIATTDLGYDLVRFWRVGASGLVLDHEVTLPFGVGPRHMVVHPSGHLHVVTEFSCEVFTLAKGADGRWAVAAATTTGAMGGDKGAELAPSRDRRFLYAGLRGSDTIAVLRVEGAGETLRPVALAETGVDTPRHHVIVRDTLLVAGQRSNEIVSLSVDARTGVPGRVRHRLEYPTPQHVLPIG